MTPIIQLPGGIDSLVTRPDYVTYANDQAPDIERGKWTRVLRKNPGGLHGGKMMPDQWLLSEKAGYRFANRAELAYCSHRFVAAGVTEIIDYIGRVDILDDPLVDGWECLRPFLESGPPEVMSIAGDAWSATYSLDTWKSQRVLALCEKLLSRGHRVYIESRPHLGDHGWWKRLTGSMALDYTDFGKQSDRLKEAALYGEVIRLTSTNALSKPEIVAAWPDFGQVTPCARMPSRYRAEQFVRPVAGGVE